MGDPLTFIFITDEQLRASLESDYEELRTCLAGGAWKAAHVMSGSIVEAVLVDYLVGAGYSKKDPLKMTLEQLIEATKAEGVLSDKTADLSSVVRGFRNLIHPGRVLRLNETVDEEGARIADALVSLIVREVAVKQAQVYGLRAEQLLAKFEGDPSALAISDHLLRDAQPTELERLLLSVIPDRYLALSDAPEFVDVDDELLSRLERLYLEAYELAPETAQEKAAKRFVSVLREDAGWKVEIYEDKFFRGYFLEHLSDSQRKLVKDHILSRIDQFVLTANLIACVEGMSAYLRPAEVNKFFDPLIRTVSYDKAKELIAAARTRIIAEFRNSLPTELETRVISRLDSWAELHREKNRDEAAGRIEAIRNQLAPPEDDNIPF